MLSIPTPFGKMNLSLGLEKKSKGPKSAGTAHEKFDTVFSHPSMRRDLVRQILEMAHLFGLGKHHLATPEWQADWIAENCNSCKLSPRCFKDSNGRAVSTPGMDASKCPNYLILKGIAEQHGHRSPKHHRVG